MRYIGNKTKLLGEIGTVLESRGITSGTLIDIFTGSASVARHFKAAGFRVLANDLLSASFTQAVAALEVSSAPAFEKLLPTLDGGRSECRANQSSTESRLETVVDFLNHHVEPRAGLIYRSFCPGGPYGRRYFRDEHGRKIDGILHFLGDRFRRGLLERGEFHLLLAALINAADRRANISGTYGAYLKSWQSNTLGELSLRVPEIVSSPVRGHAVYREDANALLPRLAGDVLYIDPPYNRRQYGANYHVLEVIAEHHRIDDLEAYERALYGKTGLRPYGDLYSAYCIGVPGQVRRRRPWNMPSTRNVGNVYDALRDLVLAANVRHVVLSYNEEGLLDREALGTILAEFAGTRRYDFSRDFTEVRYRRFRSDRDRESGTDGGGRQRRYRVIEGKDRDMIGEWIFFASRECSRLRGTSSGAPARRSKGKISGAP